MTARKFYWLFAAAFLWAIIAHSSELEQVVETLRTGRPSWIAAAIVLQIAYYLAFSGVYQTAFAALGVRSRVRDLLPMLFVSSFVNVVTPSAGAGGAAVLVEDAARRGESATRAAAGTLLALVTDLTVFFFVLIPGLWYLAVHHDLRAYEVAAVFSLIGLTGALAGVLLLGLWRPKLPTGSCGGCSARPRGRRSGCGGLHPCRTHGLIGSRESSPRPVGRSRGVRTPCCPRLPRRSRRTCSTF